MLPVPPGQVANDRLIIVEIISSQLPIEPGPVLVTGRHGVRLPVAMRDQQPIAGEQCSPLIPVAEWLHIG